MVFSIDIVLGNVLAEVKRISANAALQRGDAAHVATDDNDTLLEKFFAQVQNEMVASIKYAKKPTEFEVPANWDSSLKDSVQERVNDALIYGVLAHWYSLSAESVYSQMFAGCIEEINVLLNRRVKPVRNGR